MKRNECIGLSLAVILCSAPLAAASPAAGYSERQAAGKVIAVEPGANPPTLTMQTELGGKRVIVGTDVTRQTAIRGGVKTLADISAGQRVLLRWRRTDDRLIADQITVLSRKS